jgi:hypothetical protein
MSEDWEEQMAGQLFFWFWRGVKAVAESFWVEMSNSDVRNGSV